MNKKIPFLIIFFNTFFSFSQSILNAYAKITAVTNSSVLTLSNVNQTNHTFTVGGQVIIMQMQDDVIGTNTTNASTFGDLSSIANAGRYEIRTISAITPTSGTPTSVTITPALANTYNTGSNSSVQLISFRDLGANYTTTANITGAAWNGSVGGVVAINVTNTLTLRHRILADGIGFRGGSYSNNNGGPVCTSNSNTLYIANNNNLGFKGEGIYLNTNSSFNNARGKIASGGGGGNDHNAGGGGGGNYTAGGQGGNGYNNCSTFPGGGLGGVALSASITVNRVFMGGGGGGGQQNDGQNSAGGNGGGIILIKSNTIATGTTCASSIQISANGNTAIDGGNDGMGGGGAAGTIILQVSNYTVTATCPTTISANGGNGGNATNSARHGGGGGGAQGVVIFSTIQPTTNITTQTNNGLAGTDNSGGSTSAGSGSGSSGTGTIASVSGPLPIKLINFNAFVVESSVKLIWQTASEKNNNHFIIERSINAVDFKPIGSLAGLNNSNNLRQYELIDHYPTFGLNYYRLKQVDDDGTEFVAPIIVVEFGVLDNFKIYPNPVNEYESLIVELGNIGQHSVVLNIKDLTGKSVIEKQFDIKMGQALYLNNLDIEKGIYQLSIRVDEFEVKTQKIIVR